LGNVSNKDIAQIVGSAFALVFPSQFEGFGIPIVEAMKAGIPVITSNISSMPEIAGNAALLVDPFNPNSIAEAMILLTNSQTLHNDLKIKALQRVKNFSWEQSAAKMWEEIKITLDKFKN
ncbi:MAG: glycosyltransferase, partial [Bacteroidales bacterium]|nr:glycosyltransferase [Bacteroidales bacterium]